MTGNHTIEQCYDITEQVLQTFFYQFYQFKINLEGIILKPNMVIAGAASAHQNSINEVADATAHCLLASVPAEVPAIAFLSGGQLPKDAAAHLNAIHTKFKDQLPWIVSFCFARAIQQPALDVWKGQDANVEAAQKLLYKQAKITADAHQGKYIAALQQSVM